jgi:hypothetical protein
MESSLAAELADDALLFARAHRYTLVDRPRVELIADDRVPQMDIRVDARFADAIGGRPGAVLTPLDLPEDLATHDPSATMVFAIARPPVPVARLRVHDATGSSRVISIGDALRIGRATDNDLVLRDERVSRHHAQVSGRRGTLLFSDLGSTNGSEVNGHRVTEVVLGSGDSIRIGNCTLEVEVDEDAS